MTQRSRRGHTEEITGRLMGRHSTAAVLFHAAVAEHLGLGATDHKCLDLLRERGPMTGSDLAALTALTTGGITGVVARLENAGYVSRTADDNDGRRQIISPVPDRVGTIHAVFAPVRSELAASLAQFSVDELSAIAQFLELSTAAMYHNMAVLRAPGRGPAERVAPSSRSPSGTGAKRQRR